MENLESRGKTLPSGIYVFLHQHLYLLVGGACDHDDEHYGSEQPDAHEYLLRGAADACAGGLCCCGCGGDAEVDIHDGSGEHAAPGGEYIILECNLGDAEGVVE